MINIVHVTLSGLPTINVTNVKMDTQNVQEGRDIRYCTQNVKPKLHNLQFTDLLVNVICGSRKSKSYM